MTTERKLTTLAWTTLAVNVLVILQGAFVRATGSGAGCGRSWPRCQGEIVPLSPSVETLIEFSHRSLSLVALVLGAVLLYRAFRLRKLNRGLWVFSLAAFTFLIVEALLGAATVLYGLTGENVSTARGLMVAVHLLNSLLLVGTLTAAVAYARGKVRWPLRAAEQPLLAIVLGLGLAAMLLLMFTGGIAAMGDTMFPSESLREGIAQDFDPQAHPLVRLRVLHPLLALSVGVYLLLSLGLSWWLKPVVQARGLAQGLLGVYGIQVLVGTVNLALLAPIALQLLHLGLAVTAFALLSAYSLVELAGEAQPLARSVLGTTPERLEL